VGGPQSGHGPAVHLHHARPLPGPPARPGRPREHQPVVLPGRQDRRPGRQRGRQVEPPPHHGRRGRRLQRRGTAHPGVHRGHPAPGARPRPGEGRPRQRRRRGRADPGAARPLRRGLRGDGRSRRRPRRAARRAGRAPGPHRRRGRMGARPDPRHRHGRPTPTPARRRRVGALRGRAAPRGAVPPASLPARPPPARRAHQPPRRGVGGVARAPPAGVPGHGRGRHARPLLPRQRRGVDPRARPRPGHPLGGQLLELAGADGRPSRP